MKNKSLKMLIAFMFLCFYFTNCKKAITPAPDVVAPPSEVDKLPATTQTGANTIGCLVNGVAWLPNGVNPQTGGPNIKVTVNPNMQGGIIYVTAYQFNSPTSQLTFGSTSFTGTGIYNISQSPQTVSYGRFLSNGSFCEVSDVYPNTYLKGAFNLTKYDLANGIFAGTFEFKLFNSTSNCGDTIRFTNGRFDTKL